MSFNDQLSVMYVIIFAAFSIALFFFILWIGSKRNRDKLQEELTTANQRLDKTQINLAKGTERVTE